MKLQVKNKYTKEEFICELTKELDVLSGLNKSHYYEGYCHYILADAGCRKSKCLAIRVPGGTTGGVWVDDNNRIIKIAVGTDYVIKTYPDNINAVLQKYLNRVIKFDEQMV